MIMGSHVIVYSRDAEADRAFFADVLGQPHVDAGGGWLIFKAPPAELAVHPSDSPTGHELYFMCDDLEATMSELQTKGVDFTHDVSEERWGRMTRSGCRAVPKWGCTSPAIRSQSTCERPDPEGVVPDERIDMGPPLWVTVGR